LLSHPRASLELFALAKHFMLELLALARRSSMSGLKGKVAVVTGASKGIGAIAKGLSAAGALVIRSAALEPRGYAETREAARAAFAKSWRRE
jgi:3-oxoacyl-ACP reductase-like protein